MDKFIVLIFQTDIYAFDMPDISGSSSTQVQGY